MTSPEQARHMGATPPLRSVDLLICEQCDTVYRRRPLVRGEIASCRRCHAELERHRRLGPNELLALTVTGMVVFIQANLWPIVTIELNGQTSSTTLWGTIIVMWQRHAQIVAILAAATLFFFPLVKMLLLGWVFWFARRGRRGPGFQGAMVVLHYLAPWTMSEVFVLGAMVAIVKSRAYFGVTPDAGIFSYGALMLLITVFSSVDLRQLWAVTTPRRGT